MIHTSLERLRYILSNHGATKNTLCTLRDNIQRMIEGCADNIKITIYLDDVLDGFIEIMAGQEENLLSISIKSNGDMTHSWNRRTNELTFRVEAGVRSICKNLLWFVL